ncbi:protein of unknown function [Methylorubrum extorquens]|uniref:Uncharacterized protein n=1 Tax=Methylorubrum extorquens TaxID=408 RepID=A0A2N9AW31_METEX|nr:protein of unknown function [Methylorubrum extorquens]
MSPCTACWCAPTTRRWWSTCPMSRRPSGPRRSTGSIRSTSTREAIGRAFGRPLARADAKTCLRSRPSASSTSGSLVPPSTCRSGVLAALKGGAAARAPRLGSGGLRAEASKLFYDVAKLGDARSRAIQPASTRRSHLTPD